MRMPRIHGRPPHWSGLIVIRSSKLAISSPPSIAVARLVYLAFDISQCSSARIFQSQLSGYSASLSLRAGGASNWEVQSCRFLLNLARVIMVVMDLVELTKKPEGKRSVRRRTL